MCSDISLEFYFVFPFVFILYLMANDVEYLFMGFFLSSVYPQWNICAFTHLFIWIIWFLFLLLSSVNYFYVLDTSSLLDMWLANIFSQSVLCLFILITGSFTEQNSLILMKFNFQFFHLWIMLLMLSLMVHLHNGIYAAEKKKELIPFATAWMELESIMLSEISQAVRDKYHMISPLTET